jgi:hypothetical protein
MNGPTSEPGETIFGLTLSSAEVPPKVPGTKNWGECIIHWKKYFMDKN